MVQVLMKLLKPDSYDFPIQDEKKAKVYGKTKKEEQAKVAVKSFEQIVRFCEVPM